MKVVACLALGAFLLSSAVGCCCLGHGGGGCGPYGCGYAPTYGGGAACPGGNCAPSYGPGTLTYPPQGAFQNGGTFTPTASISPSYPQMTALEPLPTY